MPPRNRNRYTGDSSQRKAKRQVRPKQTYDQKKARAVERSVEKLGGTVSFNNMIESWAALETGANEVKHGVGDEIIANLINLGLSNIEIKSSLKCGAERISRIQRRLDAGDDYIQPERKPSSHAFSAKTILFLYGHMDSWESKLEQGSSCLHQRIKDYCIVKEIWKNLRTEYINAFNLQSPEDIEGAVVMEYSTFLQYIHETKPGLRLPRSKTDLCDSCIRLQFIVNNPTSTEDKKLNAQNESHAPGSCRIMG